MSDVGSQRDLLSDYSSDLIAGHLHLLPPTTGRVVTLYLQSRCQRKTSRSLKVSQVTVRYHLLRAKRIFDGYFKEISAYPSLKTELGGIVGDEGAYLLILRKSGVRVSVLASIFGVTQSAVSHRIARLVGLLHRSNRRDLVDAFRGQKVTP